MRVETTLVEGDDYYREGAFVVFTARYHLRRGYCCESGCRHCPYRDGGSPAGAGEDALTDDAGNRNQKTQKVDE